MNAVHTIFNRLWLKFLVLTNYLNTKRVKHYDQTNTLLPKCIWFDEFRHRLLQNWKKGVRVRWCRRATRWRRKSEEKKPQLNLYFERVDAIHKKRWIYFGRFWLLFYVSMWLRLEKCFYSLCGRGVLCPLALMPLFWLASEQARVSEVRLGGGGEGSAAS